MSYPTQQEQPGQPAPGYGTPFAPPPPAQTNGMATAGLVLGILPTGIIGLVFSILGIVRAGAVGGVGRARAWVGAVLSVLWIGAAIALVASGGSEVAKLSNPGCIAAEAYVPSWETKMEGDSADPAALKADLQAAVTELNKDAGRSTNATATAAIKKLAGDIQQLADDLDSGTVPSDALQTQIDTDGGAIDTACGR